jgi:hypothetical protein
MGSLSDHGVRPFSRSFSARPEISHQALLQISGDDFIKMSRETLQNLFRPVVTEVIPGLEGIPGSWHPSGFMVFPIGSHDQLGTLRLHVWPTAVPRRRQLKGLGPLGAICDGDIHDHAWIVSSLVLTSYQDFVYQVSFAEIDEPGENTYGVFEVDYQDSTQVLSRIRGGAKIVSTIPRHFSRGELHSLDPKTFHAPAVPLDVTAATLVFHSGRTSDRTYVLIGDGPESYRETRILITTDEAIQVKTELLRKIEAYDGL